MQHSVRSVYRSRTVQRGATTDRDLARDSRTDSDYCTEVIGQVLVHAQPFRPTISDLTVLSTTNIQCTDVIRLDKVYDSRNAETG